MRRKYLAEFLGTCTLVAVVVGSGTMATNMSADRGVGLLINTISTVFALGILILVFGSLSGAHFNPAVSLSEWAQKRLSLLGGERKDFLAPVVITSWIGSAYLFTSSTSFANPAVTLA